MLVTVECSLLIVGFGDIGGIQNFKQTNAKILEMVSHNNLLLMERLRTTQEDCDKQIKEKDDQIR